MMGGLKSINYNVYPYFKSFFRTHTNNIRHFYNGVNTVVIQFDRFALKSLPGCKLYSLNFLGRDRGVRDPINEDESEERLYSKNKTVKIKNLSRLINTIWIKKSMYIDETLLKKIKDLGITIRYSPNTITSIQDLFSHNSPRADKENLYNFDKKTCDKVIKELYIKGFNDYINAKDLLYRVFYGDKIDDKMIKFKTYNNKYYVNLTDAAYLNTLFEIIRKTIANKIYRILTEFFPSTIGIQYNILNDHVLKNTKRTFKTKRYVKTKRGFLLQQKKKNKATNKVDWINVAYYGDTDDIIAFVNRNFNKILNRIKFVNKDASEYIKRLNAKFVYENSLRDFLKFNNLKDVLQAGLQIEPIFNNKTSKFILISNDKDSLIEWIKMKLEEYISDKIARYNEGVRLSAYESEFSRVSFIKKNIDKIFDKIDIIDESSLNKNKEIILRSVCEMGLDEFLKFNNIIKHISNIKNVTYTYDKNSNIIFLECANINKIKKEIEEIAIDYIFSYLNRYFIEFYIHIDRSIVAKFIKENTLKLFNNIEFGNNNKFIKQYIEIFKNQCKKYFNKFLNISNLKKILISYCKIIPLWNKEKNKFIALVEDNTEILQRVKDQINGFLMTEMSVDDELLNNYQIDTDSIIAQYVDENFYKILNKVEFYQYPEFSKKAKPILDKIFAEIKDDASKNNFEFWILKDCGFKPKFNKDTKKFDIEVTNLEMTISNLKKAILNTIKDYETFRSNEEFLTEFLKNDNNYITEIFKAFFDEINIIY